MTTEEWIKEIPNPFREHAKRKVFEAGIRATVDHITSMEEFHWKRPKDNTNETNS